MPQPIKLDNFALTALQTCPAKYALRIPEGWTARVRSAALRFGVAVHAGLAAWYKFHDLDMALRAVEDSWEGADDPYDYRTLAKARETITKYTHKYSAESFTVVGINTDRPLVEVPFSLDTGLVTDDGTPIEYGGIFDTLIDYGQGNIFVLEHKTTSQLGNYSLAAERGNPNLPGMADALHPAVLQLIQRVASASHDEGRWTGVRRACWRSVASSHTGWPGRG